MATMSCGRSRSAGTRIGTTPVSYTHLDVYKRQHLVNTLLLLGALALTAWFSRPAMPAVTRRSRLVTAALPIALLVTVTGAIDVYKRQAQHSDGTYVLPVGAISGVTSSPAKPGEIVVIYGVGFGAVTPNIPAGEIATETNQLSASLEILFGKTPAKLPYFGLAPNFVGLYQFNVTVPAVASNDLVPLTFNLGGVAGTQTLYTAVQQ